MTTQFKIKGSWDEVKDVLKQKFLNSESNSLLSELEEENELSDLSENNIIPKTTKTLSINQTNQ